MEKSLTNNKSIKKQYLGTILLFNSTSSKFKLLMEGEDANKFEVQDHFSDLFVLLLYTIAYCVIAVAGLSAIIGFCFIIIKYIQNYKRYYLTKGTLNTLPLHNFQLGDQFETCAVCLEDFRVNDKLRVLPCDHVYHSKCIDTWLVKTNSVCPQCRKRVFPSNENLAGIWLGSPRNYASLSSSHRHSRPNDVTNSSYNQSTRNPSITTPLLGNYRSESIS